MSLDIKVADSLEHKLLPAEDCNNSTCGKCSYAQGCDTKAFGDCTHSEGSNTRAYGNSSHSEGNNTSANGDNAHAEGCTTIAYGNCSHSEGSNTATYADSAHAEGYNSKARGNRSHAEGLSTEAFGEGSHAGGNSTRAEGYSSNVEGFVSIARGNYSHAEGYNTTTQSNFTHAEGYYTQANGYGSHSEGSNSQSKGEYSHAEGYNSSSDGAYSHTEGYITKAEGYGSHAEGSNTSANGAYSHAEGTNTIANASFSHAEGYYNNTKGAIGSHIMGVYGDADTPYSWFLGGGTSDMDRALASKILYTGDAYIKNAWNAGGTNYSEIFPSECQPIEAGYFVTLEGENIRLVKCREDYILGVTTSTPGFIANSMELKKAANSLSIYKKEYEATNDLIIPEVKDYEGNVLVIEQRIKAPVPGSNTAGAASAVQYTVSDTSWSVVALLGQVAVYDDGTCKPNYYCLPNESGIATSEPEGFRVMKRLCDNQILILFR